MSNLRQSPRKIIEEFLKRAPQITQRFRKECYFKKGWEWRNLKKFENLLDFQVKLNERRQKRAISIRFKKKILQEIPHQRHNSFHAKFSRKCQIKLARFRRRSLNLTSGKIIQKISGSPTERWTSNFDFDILKHIRPTVLLSPIGDLRNFSYSFSKFYLRYYSTMEFLNLSWVFKTWSARDRDIVTISDFEFPFESLRIVGPIESVWGLGLLSSFLELCDFRHDSAKFSHV